MRASAKLILLAAILAASLPATVPRKTGNTRVRVPILPASNTAFRAQDVHATAGGSPVKVVALAGPAEDLMLMLVFDLAGDLRLAQRAKQALISELDGLPPRVHIALLRAQDGLRVIQDPTANREAIGTAVDALPVSGRAGLLDSIETAAAIADSVLAKSAVRLAILYITDSEVTNYREDFTNPVINSSDSGDLSRKFPEALIQEKISKVDANLARSQAPVFVVHISYRTDRLNEAYLNGLRQLTFTTGGTAAVCRSDAEIDAAIKDALKTIQNHYSATLEVPRVEERSLDVKLEVADPEGNQLNVGYRTRFVFKTK